MGMQHLSAGVQINPCATGTEMPPESVAEGSPEPCPLRHPSSSRTETLSLNTSWPRWGGRRKHSLSVDKDHPANYFGPELPTCTFLKSADIGGAASSSLCILQQRQRCRGRMLRGSSSTATDIPVEMQCPPTPAHSLPSVALVCHSSLGF